MCHSWLKLHVYLQNIVTNNDVTLDPTNEALVLDQN